jgi:hypothetical protein
MAARTDLVLGCNVDRIGVAAASMGSSSCRALLIARLVSSSGSALRFRVGSGTTGSGTSSGTTRRRARSFWRVRTSCVRIEPVVVGAVHRDNL